MTEAERIKRLESRLRVLGRKVKNQRRTLRSTQKALITWKTLFERELLDTIHWKDRFFKTMEQRDRPMWKKFLMRMWPALFLMGCSTSNDFIFDAYYKGCVDARSVNQSTCRDHANSYIRDLEIRRKSDRMLR